jgi:hypothetical protein
LKLLKKKNSDKDFYGIRLTTVDKMSIPSHIWYAIQLNLYKTVLLCFFHLEDFISQSCYITIFQVNTKENLRLLALRLRYPTILRGQATPNSCCYPGKITFYQKEHLRESELPISQDHISNRATTLHLAYRSLMCITSNSQTPKSIVNATT